MSFYMLPRTRQTSPAWSHELVAILSARDADELEDALNGMMSITAMQVLAFSAPIVVGTFVEDPWCVLVVYQERTDPLSGDQS
jgi:hypothetical protein